MQQTLRPHTPLRPLGFGEVLDRAVSVTVREFAVLALIYLVLAVPLGIAWYFVNASYITVITAFTDGLQSGARPEDMMRAFGRFQAPPSAVVSIGLWSAIAMLLQLLLAPLPTAALISAVATSYLGAKASFRDAYRVALRRWVPMLLLTFVWIATYAVAYAAFVFVILGITLVTFAVRSSNVFGSIVLLVAMLVGIVIAVIGFFAYQVSMVALVVDDLSFINAYVAGIRRLLSRARLKRSLLIGLVFALVSFALNVATLTGTGVFLAVAHSTVLGTLYATVLRIVAQAFTVAFITIFYFDLRVREDGLDIELTATPASAVALGSAPAG